MMLRLVLGITCDKEVSDKKEVVILGYARNVPFFTILEAVSDDSNSNYDSTYTERAGYW